MGNASPGATIPVLRMQNATLSRTEKSLLLASVQGALSLQAAVERMRRLFDPCGGAARRNVLAATDVFAPSEDGNLSYEEWVANRKAGKK